MKKSRADHDGIHRSVFQKNRRTILYTQDICAICGRYVDKSLPVSSPLSPTVDHIIPINKGGHPSDINNLQLAHRICNRLKSDKIFTDASQYRQIQVDKNKICLTRDWKNF